MTTSRAPTTIVVDVLRYLSYVAARRLGGFDVKRRKDTTPRPTDAELAILRVLWDRGPSTVREVHAALSSQGIGYTTVLKQLQVMTEKRLVTRDDAQRAHVYVSKLGEERTQRQLLADLVDRAFNGSAARLVLQALAGRPSTAQQRREIRALLEEIEKEEGK